VVVQWITLRNRIQSFVRFLLGEEAVSKVARQRYESRRHLSRAFNSQEQVVKINVNNTLAHELAKFLLCWELAKQSKKFVTEAIFNNKRRADILVLDDGEAWEVIQSESMKSIFKKNVHYPVPIVPWKAQTVIRAYAEKIRDIIGGEIF